jgi:hypothetical protein
VFFWRRKLASWNLSDIPSKPVFDATMMAPYRNGDKERIWKGAGSGALGIPIGGMCNTHEGNNIFD